MCLLIWTVFSGERCGTWASGFVHMSVVWCSAREYFAHIETLPLSVKGCSWRYLYRATPAVTCRLGFCGLVQKTALISHCTISKRCGGHIILISNPDPRTESPLHVYTNRHFSFHGFPSLVNFVKGSILHGPGPQNVKRVYGDCFPPIWHV